jgi:hypothetical protein
MTRGLFEANHFPTAGIQESGTPATSRPESDRAAVAEILAHPATLACLRHLRARGAFASMRCRFLAFLRIRIALAIAARAARESERTTRSHRG